MSWLTRGELAAHANRSGSDVGERVGRRDAAEQGELLVAAVPGEGFVPISRDARERLRVRSAATLAAAGFEAGQRVVVSLASEGDLVGALVADALALLGASVAVVGPRGRMRTLAAMRALRPQAWVTTPTGALDFLARLYLEFNVDPLELELDRIAVVGEIATPGTERRLADEFEARVVGLYADPVFAGLWACAEQGAGSWQIVAPGVVGWAALACDERVAAAPAVAAAAELVLAPDWPGPFENHLIRTGQVSVGKQLSGFFVHTIGDHVLVRGRWLSLPLLERALAQIDGLAGHRIQVTRGEGTLDRLAIALGFERESLVDHPMWTARAREAIASVVPIEFSLTTELAGAGRGGQMLIDERGHHLGRSRAAADAGGRA